MMPASTRWKSVLPEHASLGSRFASEIRAESSCHPPPDGILAHRLASLLRATLGTVPMNMVPGHIAGISSIFIFHLKARGDEVNRSLPVAYLSNPSESSPPKKPRVLLQITCTSWSRCVEHPS